MTIGVLKLDLMIPQARSLKDRRRVVKSLKQQIHNRFNCSVAETGCKEMWGRAQLTACIIGDDSRFVNTQLNEVLRFAENRHDAEVCDVHIEML